MTFVRARSLLVLRWSSSLFVWVLFGSCWLCVVSKSVREKQFLRKNPTCQIGRLQKRILQFKENELAF